MSALIRMLTPAEQQTKYVDCCWTWHWHSDPHACVRLPVFRLATPHGEMDFCPEHIDYMLAALPPEWIAGWAYREPVTIGSERDDIPF